MALKVIFVVGARGIGMHMVSVLISEMVRPDAPKTSTKTTIIRSNPRGNRGTMHAPSAYNVSPKARHAHCSAVLGPTSKRTSTSTLALGFHPLGPYSCHVRAYYCSDTFRHKMFRPLFFLLALFTLLTDWASIVAPNTLKLHTSSGCGKREAHINWFVVMQRRHPFLELS